MSRTNMRLGAIVATVCLSLGACANGTPVSGNSANTEGNSTEVTYRLWDSGQQATYQKCATAFEKDTGIKVTIEQQGWDDYWKNLTTDFVSGTAPDVITNHVQYYPELASKGQLLDLNTFIHDGDIDFSQYTGDLASLWEKDGARYGIPQDWDTIALVYNTQLVQEAGITSDELKNLTWNPQDGGTFGKLIAHLTVDENGKRGDEPGFDKEHIKVYGWGLEKGGGIVGQGPWSWLALSNGFQYLDKNPFGTEYQLADPKLAEALSWWQEQIAAGYVTPLEIAGPLGLEPMMEQGKAALVPDGSWRINLWSSSEKNTFGFAPLPIGPQGRKTIINGLAPSITKQAKNPEGAWLWVKYLTSDKCQSIVADDATVFPSLKEFSTKAAAAHEKAGRDVSAFTEITENPANLAYYPITDKGNEIGAEGQVVIDEIEQLSVKPREALKTLNEKVNQILADTK
ncbi:MULTISPECIES: ABC transporter substrate-binding protein [Arcanobacterium]|uniref:Sugar ABC transporter substrate-binding protein n=1 Tax=Arcanobacterium buesumense TaxID=2722751 RepID=A0A6H2EJL3_9ACTO|nr:MULTISPECIES: sugar ABC transporter substrate-binding protein [Arcanobacterium]QJC21526.1 sugar ABC transporter substrate-binding protein [Arcanobacterium buesumense]